MICSGGRQAYMAACKVPSLDAAVDCWGGRVIMKPEDITAWAHEHMAAFKVPRVVQFVEDLPKTATGKIFWRGLQEAENRALAARE